MRRAGSTRPVYSTDQGRICPDCRQPVIRCGCGPKRASAAPGTKTPNDGAVRVGRETKGRGGKAVTVVRGVNLDPAGLAALGKRLKTACGSGGTVKDDTIEIQGEHRDRVVAFLQSEGFRVKRAGG